MAMLGNTDVLKDLHQDLARKYRLHGSKVQDIWRSFTKAQRAKAMKAGAAGEAVPRHRRDTLLSGTVSIIPEWNLKDITEPGSDFFLELLRHRATTSLKYQYAQGMDDDSLGDHAFVLQMMSKNTFRYPDTNDDCWSLFFDEEYYGKSIRVKADRDSFLSQMGPCINNGTCVSQATGDLIVTRQLNLAQLLVIIIDDILELGSTTRAQNERLQKRDTASATAALAKLTIRSKPTKFALSDLLEIAMEQKASMNDELNLMYIEPVVLAHYVNVWFYSRPELVADEKGRILPALTDRYISATMFDAIQNAVKTVAVWNYITCLLQLLQDTTDKVYRVAIHQELSNTCQMEFSRTQSLLKRHVQSGAGAKFFKRIANATGYGNARVVMKVKPETLTRENSQLHYLLRLCQTETTAAKAVVWLDQVSSLHKSHIDERERLAEREFDAVCDTAAIVSLMQDLSSGISMPPPSRNKGQLFVSRLRNLETELSELKKELDLRDFVVPIDNLLETGMAENALKALRDFVVEKAGSNLDFLYQDAIDDSIGDLDKQYRQVKAKTEKIQTGFVPVLDEAAESSQTRIKQRREKEKTRPAYPSTYEINLPAEARNDEDPAAAVTWEKKQVKSSTFNVFSTFFSKAEARGSVSWVAFEAAMADLGFSVIPKFGSVFTFLPPETMGATRSFTVNRPHKSNIEGWQLPIISRRLKRVYGWDENTFKVI